MTNRKRIKLPKGDNLTIYQSRNKWLQLKWRWRLQDGGNNRIIGSSQPSGYHNRQDCVDNYLRVGTSAMGIGQLI